MVVMVMVHGVGGGNANGHGGSGWVVGRDLISSPRNIAIAIAIASLTIYQRAAPRRPDWHVDTPADTPASVRGIVGESSRNVG